MKTYAINFLLLGEHPANSIEITASKTDTIYDFKLKIIEIYRHLLEGISIHRLLLWRADIFVSYGLMQEDVRYEILEELRKNYREIDIRTVLEGKLLVDDPYTKLADYFRSNVLPQPPVDDAGYINFIIGRPKNVPIYNISVPTSNPETFNVWSLSPRTRLALPASLEECSDRSKRLRREHEQEFRSAIDTGLSMGATSDLGQASNFFRFNKDPLILMGRPLEARGPPITIFNNIFSKFLQDLENEDLNIKTSLNGWYTGNIYSWTQALIELALKRYEAVGDRMLAMRSHLRWMFGFIGRQCVRDNDVAGGTISSDVGSQCAWSAIFEAQNEFGSSDVDPIFQGAMHYLRYWSHSLSEVPRDSSCCPTFIISIIGTYICVLGGVFTTLPVIEALADIDFLCIDPGRDEEIKRIARFFVALSRGIQRLRTFYEGLSPNPVLSTQRGFPYLRQFQDQNGNVTKFNYIRRLFHDQSIAIWKAETENKTPLIVKFAKKYHTAAHHVCAAQGFAPTLFYVSDDEEKKALGGYRAVIMSYIVGVPLSTVHTMFKLQKKNNDLKLEKINADQSRKQEIYVLQEQIKYRLANDPALNGSLFPVFDGSQKDIETIFQDVESAVRLLHSQDFVFADLRAPNILAVKISTRWHGILVDFDWCGKHNEDRYPFCMNKNITWPQGAEPNAILQKEHDLYFLGVLKDAFSEIFPPPSQ